MATPADAVAEEAARLRAEILKLESGSDEQLALYERAVTMTQWSTMLGQNVRELDVMLHIVLNGIRSATYAGRALFPFNKHLLTSLAGAALCHFERFDYRFEMSDLDEAERYASQVLELQGDNDVEPFASVVAHLVLGRVAIRRSGLGMDPEAVHRIIPALRECVDQGADPLVAATLAECLRVSVAHPETTPEEAAQALNDAGGLLATVLHHPLPALAVAPVWKAQFLAELALVHFAAYQLWGREGEREKAVALSRDAIEAFPDGPEIALTAAIIDDTAASYHKAMKLSTRNAFVYRQASTMLAYALYDEGDDEGVGVVAVDALTMLHGRAERQVLDEDKLFFMREIADLVALAVPALAAVPGRTMSAIVNIERARTRILRERFPSDELELYQLSQVRPDLANPLRRALETLRSPDASSFACGRARDSLMTLQAEAREVPGFAGFRDVSAMDELALDAPLVYMVPGYPQGVAFVLHPGGGATAHALPACLRSPVPQPVVSFQQATFASDWPAGARKAAIADVASWAWDALYAPIRRAIRANPYVHVVMTSYLTGIPLHAACSSEGRYALEEIEIRYVPSATALLAARKRQIPALDPKFLGIPQPTDAGRPLANAQAEVEDVAAYFPGAQVLAQDTVDRNSILRALSGVGMLHASCHGLADAEDPLASGLELAHGERFTLRDLFEQPQDHLLLAVLSACQTNVPDVDLPDEAISLASGILISGCRSVVASAWLIPDAATADLMRDMYRRWREDGLGLPEALRAAQLGAISRAPYYWAGFSYLGP